MFAARFELPFGQVVRCHVTAILRPCHFRGRKETDSLGIGRRHSQGQRQRKSKKKRRKVWSEMSKH